MPHRKQGRTPPEHLPPPPKRRRRETLDALHIIAEISAGGPEGWFEARWTSGRNAINMLDALYVGTRTTARGAALALAREAYTRSNYATCEDALEALRTCDAPLGEVAIMTAALRCAQVMAASSDGGGHVYNEILLAHWRRFGVVDAHVESIVLTHRLRDALGVCPPASVVNAFTQAWRAHAYRAAFALRAW